MNDLTSASQILRNAKLPEEIFGIPHGRVESVDLLAHVKGEYRRMATMLHPDKFPGGPERELATDLFSILSEFKRQADTAIVENQYGKPRFATAPTPKSEFPIVISTKLMKYELTGLLAKGSIADVYECDGCVVKVARHAGDNDLLENEAKHLKEIYPPIQPEVQYFRHLPKLLDSFTLKGKTGAPRRVNVIARTPGMVSLADVLKAYPNGLDFRDVAWMWKRCLTAIGFIHRKGFVHGAIHKDHILVHPTEHGAKIIDWCYSVKYGRIIKAADPITTEIAMPEILGKRPATAATDICMLTVTMMGMFDANVPKKIKSFANGCLIKNVTMRPNDAWSLHDELIELLEQLVGKPKYRPLAMPATT